MSGVRHLNTHFQSLDELDEKIHLGLPFECNRLGGDEHQKRKKRGEGRRIEKRETLVSTISVTPAIRIGWGVSSSTASHTRK